MYYICVSSRTTHGTGTFYTTDGAIEAARKVDELIASGVDKHELIVIAADPSLTWDADSIHAHAAKNDPPANGSFWGVGSRPD